MSSVLFGLAGRCLTNRHMRTLVGLEMALWNDTKAGSGLPGRPCAMAWIVQQNVVSSFV